MGNKKAKQQRKAAREAVAALYREIPQVRCKGLCHETCGSIPVVDAEMPVFKKALKGPLQHTMPIPRHGERDSNGNIIPDGVLICGDKDITCPALTEDMRCGVYADRPLICRLYGVVNSPKMICPHGCTPERWVKNDEVGGWYSRLREIERGKKQ